MQVTHCPECATAFKVTPEQLQLAGGWVRCGRCGAVFEALKHLEPPEPASEAEHAPPVERAVPEPRRSQRDVQRSSAPERRSLGVMAGEPTFQADVTMPMPSAHELASSEPRPHKPGVWIAACSLLVCVLLWQMVLYKRDWLMAQEPALRGVLSVLCAPAGCEPAWPRLPESLQIDSSSFTHDPQGFYSVQLRIKNTEHFILAAPHVELSLLDVYDDVVLRRVFAPDELKLVEQMTPLRDTRASLEFDLDAHVAQRVTGYRVLLFYP